LEQRAAQLAVQLLAQLAGRARGRMLLQAMELLVRKLPWRN
jgi:hypothetical protein